MSNQEVKEKVKKPFYKKVWFWVVVVIVVAIAAGSGGSSTTAEKEQTSAEKESKNNTDVAETAKTEEAAEAEEQEEIVYTAYTVSQMQDDLDANALKAESTYNKQYVEITGRLGTIDSSGAYITLLPTDDEWAIMGIQCYIQSEEQKAQVMEMSTGDTVTLRGKVTGVGEVMGYSLDIDSIN